MQSESGAPSPEEEMLESDEGLVFAYSIEIDTSSPEALQNQLLNLLDMHSKTWRETDFSGIVYFRCVKEGVNDYALQVLDGMVGAIFSSAQDVASRSGLTALNGQRIILRYSITDKF